MAENTKTQQSFLDLPARQDEPFWPNENREDSAEERLENLHGQMSLAFDMPASVTAPKASNARNACPECGADLRHESKCAYCLCGYSECPLGDAPD